MPTLSELLSMVGRSITDPREGAEEVLALGVPARALWLVMAVVVVLSILIGNATALIVGGGQLVGGGLMASPLILGLLQFAVLAITIGAIHRIGRAFGGTGSLPEAVVLTSWLQFIMICAQIAQTVAFLVIPPLGGLVGIASLGLFLWLLTNFIAVLHGFRSRAQVFLMVLAAGFGIAMTITIVLSMFGVTIGMGMGDI